MIAFSDEELIRGLHADDPGTLELLVAQYWWCLVRFADRILAGDGNGEDVVQETFFRVWARRRELKPAGSLRAFLYTLTRNTAIDERRRAALRPAGVTVIETPTDSPSPLELAIASELATAASAAVARLPARQRKIFLLVRVHGLSHEEVAASMGVAPQTVANQVSTALARLRVDLARFGAAVSARGAFGAYPALPCHRKTDRASPMRRGTGSTRGVGRLASDVPVRVTNTCA